MAKLEYTRSRHLLMQVMMWLVLAGAVGLAALVNVQAERRQRVTLSEPIAVNGLMIRLPVGWRLIAADDPRIVAQVVEPRTGRSISVIVDQSNWSDPFEYLVFSGLLHPAYITAQQGQTESQPLRFAGAEGVLLSGVRLVGSRDDGEIVKDVIACAILREGVAVTILLRGPGMFDARDIALVRLLAEEVEVR